MSASTTPLSARPSTRLPKPTTHTVRGAARPRHGTGWSRADQHVLVPSRSGLREALKVHPAARPTQLVRTCFRAPSDTSLRSGVVVDQAFSALRCAGSLITWMRCARTVPPSSRDSTPRLTVPSYRRRRDNNDYTDSMEGVSDREAPAQPAACTIAANIVRSAM
eukprot:3981257-Prymnesium_polylepis.1